MESQGDVRASRKERERIAGRASQAVVLVGVGAGLALLALADPEALLDRSMSWPARLRTHSMVWLLAHDARWLASVCTLALVPLVFVWWRRTTVPFGRGLGVGLSLTVGVSMWATALFGDANTWMHATYVPLLLAAAAFALAFRIAPGPPDPDAIDAVSERRLLRDHRRSA